MHPSPELSFNLFSDKNLRITINWLLNGLQQTSFGVHKIKTTYHLFAGLLLLKDHGCLRVYSNSSSDVFTDEEGNTNSTYLESGVQEDYPIKATKL